MFNEYGPRWRIEYLLWTDSGFQPINYGEPGTYPININVTHWYRDAMSSPPIKDAEKLVVKTQTFFYCDGIEDFIAKHRIKLYAMYGNAVEVIINDIPENVYNEMLERFKYNPVRLNVRNEKKNTQKG